MSATGATRRCTFVLFWLALSGAVVQAEPQGPSTEAAGATGASNLWLVAGGASATLRGDCQTCEEDFPYRHSASILANIGYRVNSRMDVGGELFWVPVEAADDQQIRTTHVDAIAQFRPWASKGFFIKGGAGMAFVRNWIDVTDAPITSKALSIVIGTGWEFRPTARFGLQLFAAQHAAALGDLQTSTSEFQDVLGNFWSVGAAVVFR